MREKIFLTLFFGFVTTIICTGQELSRNIENTIGETLYAKFTGTCYVKATTPNSFLMLMNTNSSSESYNKAFVLFAENTINKPALDEKASYEIFIPTNREGML